LAFLLLASSFSQAGQGSSTIAIPVPPAAKDFAEGFRRDFDAAFFGDGAVVLEFETAGTGAVGVEAEGAEDDGR